jgi:hypothetical protein
VDERFLGALVEHVTTGMGGKVDKVPRVFLRELVDVLDRVDQHPDYEPARQYKLDLDEANLTPEELAAKHGRTEEPSAPDEDEPPTIPATVKKRLDG